MNIKEARKIQPGALVRTSWATNNNATQGIVLAKEYERADKREQILGQWKPERYILTVSWFPNQHDDQYAPKGISKRSSWDLMVISHVE